MVSILNRLGVDTIFLVYGAAIAGLVEALESSGIRHICPMHEQAAGFMAEGYSKMNGFGVAMATSGPGALNLVTPIANCYYDSCPVLFITGQVNSRFMRPNDKIRQVGFQETPIVDIVRPITKFAVTVTADNAIEMTDKAIYLAKAGRPGPTLLDVPLDVQRA